MQKITISDFSGGIQESTSPDDFTDRQWAALKGVVLRDETTAQTQWPAQRIGNITNVNAVFPLEASSGTYLVAIKLDGSIWWCKVPATTEVFGVANSVTWTQVTTASHKGFARDLSTSFEPATPTSITQPDISITSIPDYKFITPLPFEVYKYVKQPFNTRSWDFSQDYIPENPSGDPTSPAFGNKGSAPGVLIGCRRKFRTNSLGALRFGIFSGTTEIPIEDHQILVAYVDPTADAVEVAVFPNIRRWPTFSSGGVWAQTTDNEGNIAGAETAKYPIIPKYITKASLQTPQGTIDDFTQSFPFPSGDIFVPNAYNAFHPYTYLDADSALLPGRGIIPRANVGTMWGGQLVLGDIEWRSDRAVDASATGKVTIPANSAYIGYGALYENNTEPHRGKLFYSEDDIDVFDPRAVVGVANTDARIAAMYMLDNRLICITTAGGPNDGVVALSGNLGQLISYSESSSPNPFAIRRQLIRGGVGVADYPTNIDGHVTQACMWSETGTVVFVDAGGGIFYTDGEGCDRLDRYGPKTPVSSSYRDHVAATGKYLFAWRDSRLLVLSIVSSGQGVASGCWTELVPPTPFGEIEDADDIRSMVGVANQMFMVAQGAVFRYALNGPEEEVGCINGDPVEVTISSPTVGDGSGHRKTNWFRTGFSFYTPTECTIKTVSTKGEGALVELTAWNAPTYSAAIDTTYGIGHHDVVVPSGIGRQEVASATITLEGNAIINGVSFWGTGGVMSRGEQDVA